ncbi:bifunctional phosphoglucose/phosphomannose isomerase [Candidatus Omnitrophota bacterium]
MSRQSMSGANIKKLDKSGMLGLLLEFPLQCIRAKEIAAGAKILFEKRDFRKIVFAGLGGSAIGADLVRSYLYFESKIPVLVFREYDLPGFVDESTLVFISSYSGNTEETLSAFRQAKEKNATIVAISSDGSLKESAAEYGLSFIEIPKGLPPRCALGYLSLIPLCILSRLRLIKKIDPQINSLVATLDELKKRSLRPGIAKKDNIAKSIASRLYNKFAVIYAPCVHFDVTAVRMRGQLNENSKALASSHVFPEMNHNEIVGWQNPKKVFKKLSVVMLRDGKMHPRTSKRMDITREMIKQEGVDVTEVNSRGDNLLSRIFSLIYIGDFISFYLAILYGIDPTPVERVTYLKKELAKG